MKTVETEQGEDVISSRNGKWVAPLVPCLIQPKRVRNSWRDLPGWENFRYESSIFAPLDEQQLADEGWH